MTPEERQRRIHELAERLAERLAEQWPETGADINDLEDFAERMGQDVQRELIERTLPEEAERKEGNQSTCPCRGTATFQRYHGLTVVTTAGRVRVRRAYYHCAGCGQGHCPADARLRLGPSNTTPTVQARLAVLSALAGLLASYHLDLPSGPAIVLTAGLLWAISVVTGPVDGLLSRLVRRPHLAG